MERHDQHWIPIANIQIQAGADEIRHSNALPSEVSLRYPSTAIIEANK